MKFTLIYDNIIEYNYGAGENNPINNNAQDYNKNNISCKNL